MSETRLQRLVDPELCSACYSCYEACPKGAVMIERRRVAIDPDLCAMCGDCVPDCATGAIEVLRIVPLAAPFVVSEQLAWDSLPPDDLVAN